MQALRLLTAAGADQFLDLIYRALGDASWRVRKEAAEIFLALPGANTLAGEVIELLHSEDNAGLRNAAVEILVGIGQPAVSHLVDELQCRDHDVRKFVLDILGDIRDEGAIAAMITALADDDGNVRAAAAENLGKLRATEAVPALLDTLAGPDLLLRFTILESLGQIGVSVPMPRLLHLSQDRLLRKALVDCLGKVGGSTAVPFLVATLTDEMRNVREAAANALACIAKSETEESVRRELAAMHGNPSAKALYELLDVHDPTLKKSVIRLVGLTGDAAVAPRLFTFLDQEELRQEAAKAIIALGPAAATTLMPLWDGAAERERAYLAYLFGEFGYRAALPQLLQALDADDDDLKRMAIHALGKLGGVGELHALLDALGSASVDVGAAAMQALCQIGDRHREAALASLAPLLEAEDAAVRMRAVEILGRFGGAAIDHYLGFALKDESSQVRRAAVRACEEHLHEGQLQSLMLVLTDEDVEVRRMTAEVLGRKGFLQALRPLELALQDDDLWVRAAAVRSLGRIGGAEVLPVVRRALTDPVGLVTIAAIETLYDLSPQQALADLVGLLEHPDEEVVNVVLQLLARSGDQAWIDTSGERLLNHRHWEVRVACARLLAEVRGAKSRSLLEARLLIEGEELVRQQLQELLLSLKSTQG